MTWISRFCAARGRTARKAIRIALSLTTRRSTVIAEPPCSEGIILASQRWALSNARSSVAVLLLFVLPVAAFFAILVAPLALLLFFLAGALAPLFLFLAQPLEALLLFLPPLIRALRRAVAYALCVPFAIAISAPADARRRVIVAYARAVSSHHRIAT